MKISNNFVKITALTTVLAGTAACERKPLKELPKQNVPQNVLTKIDSLIRETQKVLNDTSYRFYGNDTLCLDNDFSNAPENFVEKMNKSAASKTGRTIIGTRFVYSPMYKSAALKYQIHHDYADNYISPKGVIDGNKLYTTGDADIYVPVSYYGVPNPKIKK